MYHKHFRRLLSFKEGKLTELRPVLAGEETDDRLKAKEKKKQPGSELGRDVRRLPPIERDDFRFRARLLPF